MEKGEPNCPIAIIGMGCRYPGANTPLELWENILARRRQFRRMPDCRTPLSDYYHADPEKPDKTYLQYVAVIDGFNFDWEKRRIPFSTYQSTDIVHWLALEVAITTFTDAGYTTESIPKCKTGVIVGNTLTGEYTRSNAMRLRWPFIRKILYASAKTNNIKGYTLSQLERRMETLFKSVSPSIDEDSLAGGLSNTIAGRICNYLDLDGGGYTVDGACSSSLIAIATAANGLKNRDLDLAIAGGVDINLDPFELIGFAKAGALSANEMRVYDKRANGFFPGEGCGFVLLKRLDDALDDNNHIYAVLHGWGISSDGKGASITAPNADGQARAILRAYGRAPYKINQIDFIEGHGTGTAVGDNVELQGIARSISETQKASHEIDRFCGITSLKSIIGHTKAAAGVGAFIKAVIAVNNRTLPPTAGCRHPHPSFKGEAKALYPILTGKSIAPSKIVRAGISAMGFGGINCHVNIESAGPPSPNLTSSMEVRSLLASNQKSELFIFSSQSSKDLQKQIKTISNEAPNISLAEMTDLAADLAVKSDPRGKFRLAIVASNPGQLCERLEIATKKLSKKPLDHSIQWQDAKNQIWVGHQLTLPNIGFVFPGQGAQFLNMGQRLVARYEWASEIVRLTDQILTRNGQMPISKKIYRSLDKVLGTKLPKIWTQELSQTEYAQPAICQNSIIWLNWLKKIGISPTAIGGHSLGELTAFHAAGAFDVETLIRFSGFRGNIFSTEADKAGMMVILRCAKNQVRTLLEKVNSYATIANINSPRQTVVAGTKNAIKQISNLAAIEGITIFPLPVSGAFHSNLVLTVSDAIRKEMILPFEISNLNFRLFSGIDGMELNPGLKLKSYFADQIVAPVNFIAVVKSMTESCDFFIEVGPGQALSNMINEINSETGPFCLPVESTPGNERDVNTLLATLFIRGMTIKWDIVYESRLIRPFIQPSKREFFSNPCESFLNKNDFTNSLSDMPDVKTFESLLAGLGDISINEIEQYLKTRGAFLARVIQADMEHPLYQRQELQNNEDNNAENILLDDSKKNSEEAKTSIESIVIETIGEVTGFSKDILDPNMALLDDLNLDSIKTGELLTRLARTIGVTGEIQQIDLAKATIREVSQLLKSAKNIKNKSLKHDKPDILKAIQNQIASLLGISAEMINADATLYKDLNINKEQLKKILPSLSSRIKVDIHVDIEPLLKRSLRQIASILERLYQQQQSPYPNVQYTPHRPPWTREFHISMDTRPLINRVTTEKRRCEDDWQLAHAFIIADNVENKVAQSLSERLKELGAKVDLRTHKHTLNNNLLNHSDYTHIFNILPIRSKNNKITDERIDIREIITRLAGSTKVASASLAPRRRNNLIYIQFGGGYFGTQSETAYFNQCCATALASSIHQERTDLRVRVLDFSPMLPNDSIAEKTITEINTPDAFRTVGYDSKLNRREIFQTLLEPGTYKAGTFSWDKRDVIIVTGGAKGITAECAFGVAAACGAQMALVGRSSFPGKIDHPLESSEIVTILDRYSERNLKAKYYSCDICDHQAVKNLVRKISKDMGQITGVIHGAGLNIPKVSTNVTIEDAIREVSPKVVGALNLMAELYKKPPKLFIGLTSLSGVTGMQGNAWYSFSNEALNIILNRFGSDYPETRTLSVAYSIWEDKGMGARMGSVSLFNSQGISPITTKDGVDRFVRLFFNDPGVNQVIVAARLSGLNTWRFNSIQDTKKYRFLEKPLHVTPGVESAFQVHLSIEKDVYLTDHQFNGSYLFPAVFGLEAMAQAVAHVTGINDFGRLRIENIDLSQTIAVDPRKGTEIIIWAEVETQISDSALTIIKAGIYQPGLGNDKDSFSATYILGLNSKPQNKTFNLPKQALEIHPGPDLYRKTQLFLGKRFQRIEAVLTLESQNGSGKAIVTSKKKPTDVVSADSFSDFKYLSMLLDDPFLRDSMLQTVAIILPQDTLLPIQIDRIDLYPTTIKETSQTDLARIISAELLSREDYRTNSIVIASNSSGKIVERMEGLRFRVLSHHEDRPTVEDLHCPNHRDSKILSDVIKNYKKIFNIDPPYTRMGYFAGLPNLSSFLVQKTITPFLIETVNNAIHNSKEISEDFKIFFDQTGTPIVKSKTDLGVKLSLSFDNRLCLAVAAKGIQGCKISKKLSHSLTEWIHLIGDRHSGLLDSFIEKSKSIDHAGTRLWTILELSRILFGNDFEDLSVANESNDAMLLQTQSFKSLILSFPLRFTLGEERFIAMAVKLQPELPKTNLLPEYGDYDDLFNISAYDVRKNGPQGQDIFVQRLPVTFKQSAQLSRKIYFSNYFFWIGNVREASAWPILDKMGKEFATGKWGVVTNKTKIKIIGEATIKDKIEIHFWASGNSGPKNSTMDLSYDFRKITKAGSYERLAWCEQTTTWVEILSHGSVKPAPYPTYYWELMKDMLPKNNSSNKPPTIPEPLSMLFSIEDQLIYQAQTAPTIQPLIFKKIIETSLEDSNVVGNIYFANYYAWQGRVRDQYFYSLIPEYFRGIGEKGELLCLECKVDHLREAMPFDQISITMALKTWKTSSVDLYFEYFRIEPDGKQTKLAYGEQKAVWVIRDASGQPVPEPFPQTVQEAFRRAISSTK